MRWLLLDEILEIKKGESARSKSRIPATNYSAEVLLLEMMAQTGGVLLGAENDYKDDVIFAKIEAAQFPAVGFPDEPIEIIAVADGLRPEGSWVQGTVKNARAVFATARIMLMNAGTLVPGKTVSTTFHPEFMNHFKIREKIK